ncbi:hypothetical protein NPIL_624731 [Nephila pilipes]|uniref:Uncharacterized protein n=1 Tax=Nephila pilipes TaxID=299642 RepID=A0A8X6QL37_NEPPI|nr:hypothetical protein NPIL_624731 [Nephila pilipes]
METRYRYATPLVIGTIGNAVCQYCLSHRTAPNWHQLTTSCSQESRRNSRAIILRLWEPSKEVTMRSFDTMWRNEGPPL